MNFDIAYESDIRDISKIFYNPALSQAERYDRITAYFNSKSFLTAASGIVSLIRNGGQMRLILDTVTSEEDKEAIEGEVRSKIIEDLEDIDEEIVRDHVALLAWMLDEGVLDIKIAKIRKRQGIVHPKVGIIFDREGNKLAFDGSMNETYSGWKNNVESLTIYKGWVSGQEDYVSEKEDTFKRFWWGETSAIDVFELDEAIEEEILEYKPKDEEELNETINRVKRYEAKENQEELTPRYYQREAIDNWEKNEFRGIWEMATGTGKTLTAIWGLERIREKQDDSLVAVVVCPVSHLIEQWRDDLEERGFSTLSTQDYQWEEKFETQRGKMVAGANDLTVVLTTYQKYCKEDFRSLLREVRQQKLLICDEVHHAGATTYSEGLCSFYDYRLGLSATPERYMDPEGTATIQDYFGGVVKEYGLEKAIREDHLAEYRYHIKVSDLDEEEIEGYKDHTSKIAYLMGKDSLSEDERGRLEYHLRERAKILKKASDKERVLKEIIEERGSLEKTIIFCEDGDQVEEAESILEDKDILFAEVTKDQSNKERRKRANNLRDGKIGVLVAMGVLDEGFDLPSAKNAILMSSTGNPAQYIQRRGRVLRMPKEEGQVGEYSANIYDILVVPGTKKEDYEMEDFERKVLEKELERFKRFAELAKNKDELEETLNNITSQMGDRIDDG